MSQSVSQACAWLESAEIHKDRSVAKVIGTLQTKLLCQPGLADAARTCKGHEATLVQKCEHTLEIILAATERCEGQRQTIVALQIQRRCSGFERGL